VIYCFVCETILVSSKNSARKTASELSWFMDRRILDPNSDIDCQDRPEPL
jgi:hypothetical protein